MQHRHHKETKCIIASVSVFCHIAGLGEGEALGPHKLDPRDPLADAWKVNFQNNSRDREPDMKVETEFTFYQLKSLPTSSSIGLVFASVALVAVIVLVRC